MKNKLFVLTLIFTNLFLLFVGNTKAPILTEGEEDLFITSLNQEGQVVLSGVNDNSLNEYRIYASDNIDVIGENAFKNCTNVSTIMVSSSITSIEKGAFEIASLNTIIFTGSEILWDSYNYSFTKNIVYYGYDEGFINYWNEVVRPNENTSICDLNYETYVVIKNLYSSLNEEDKAVVDAYKDKNDISIKDSIKFLNSFFNPDTTPSRTTDELKQGTTLRLVIYIAIFGLTSICVFFLLKTKKIID